MTIATHVRGPYSVLTTLGAAVHHLWKAEDGTYLVTSSASNVLVSETIVFESDANGEADVENFRTLSTVGLDSHEEALKEAGYTASRP